MIGWAEASETESIFTIWKECFGDDDAYIRFFLKKLYQPQRCLVYRAGGRPVAMLHLLPFELHDAENSYPARYIYAAATLPQNQRQGIMAKLIDSAVDIGVKKGLNFTALLPANDKLYDYYEKCGFKTSFYLRRGVLLRNELAAIASRGPDLTLPDIERMYGQRKSFFNPSVLWGREMFAYIIDEWRFTGGEILSWADGYALVRRVGDTLFIKEACMDESGFGQLAATVLDHYEIEKFIFHLREPSNLLQNGDARRCGMLRRGNDDNRDIPRYTYFNLMLD